MTMPQPYLTGAAAVAAVAGVGVGTRRLEEGGGEDKLLGRLAHICSSSALFSSDYV